MQRMHKSKTINIYDNLRILKTMKQDSVNNSITYTEGKSFSDGNIVAGVADDGITINFNQTVNNMNSLLLLERNDAVALYAVMSAALKSQGWI